MSMRLLLLASLFISFNLNAQFRCQDIQQQKALKTQGIEQTSINNNAKSDTIDILHYDLDLNLYSISSMNLKGTCTIKLTPKMSGVSSMELDLLQLQIDSIESNGVNLNYTYNDTIIRLDLGGVFSPTDTLDIKVHYHGSPVGDGSGWGGFHYQAGYYYNLGVGFAADPHTYGRVWFPCFDNFVEKSTYSFMILTKDPLNAYCNGVRTNIYTSGTDSLISEWDLSDPIPTYLASVAVSTYQELQSSVQGNLGNIPIWLMAKAQDTANLRNSFRNLNQILLAFEHYFGDYRWQKIGYAATTVGAMEHATSIHYPISLIDGTLNGEDIIAHELAHHWWGNLVTCETADDMWINEGMAEYLSHLYLEQVYSRERYISEVRNNAFRVLNAAHNDDNGYRAIFGLPHEFVYGTHVYQKGAMVGHNLRGYMGDSKFFSGLTTLLNNNAFENISTAEFESQLSSISGQNLSSFFNAWVTNPGYASFSIDSFHFDSQSGDLFVQLAQNLREAPALFNDVPVEVSFFSATGDTTSRTIMVSGSLGSNTFSNFPFKPEFGVVGYSGKLLTGDTYDYRNIKQNRLYIDQYSKLRLSTTNVSDSTQLIVMHHWAGPRNRTSPGKDYRISTSRFWSVNGFDFSNSDITARINYNGTANGMDGDLLQVTEDSLKVLYRANPWDRWELYEDQVKTDLGSSTNGIGYIELEHLKPGDYVLANTAEEIGIEELNPEKGQLNIYPNPTKDKLFIELDKESNVDASITITDGNGKLLYSRNHQVADGLVQIDLKELPAQVVTVNIDGQSQKVSLLK